MRALIAATLAAASAAEPARADDACLSFRFAGEVRGEQPFQQSIGADLLFFLDPVDAAGRGWAYEIGPASSSTPADRQMIYLVTPPYRGRLVTSIDTSYAWPAQDAAAPGEHNFWFLIRAADVEVAGHAVRQLIFSGATQTTEESLAQLAALPMGRGTFRIVDSDFKPGTAKWGEVIPPELLEHGYPDVAILESLYGVIERIAFEVELVVPSNYPAPPDLRPRSASCPEPWARQWPTLRAD